MSACRVWRVRFSNAWSTYTPSHTSRYRRPGTQPRHGLGSHTPPTHGRHGLPVTRLKTVLYEIQLVACRPPRLLRKGSDVLKRRPEPKQALLRHGLIYKFLYAGQSPKSLQDPFLPELT